MPQGNRTGPEGQGPRTGRQRGLCSGFDSPENLKSFGNRRGFGRGFGRGSGMRRNRYFFNAQTVLPKDEIAMLKLQANEIKVTQDAIQKRINELEKNSE
jgi:hypothetical protein